jgi:hypothetical protein
MNIFLTKAPTSNITTLSENQIGSGFGRSLGVAFSLLG